MPFRAEMDPTLTPLVRIGDDPNLLSPADIFNATIENFPWHKLNEEFRWTIGMNKREAQLYFTTKTGERAIQSCVFTYLVSKSETPAPIQLAHRYRSANEMLLDQITNIADLGDVTLKVDSFGQFGPTEKKSPGTWGRAV
jgi:hypothetical protein